MTDRRDCRLDARHKEVPTVKYMKYYSTYLKESHTCGLYRPRTLTIIRVMRCREIRKENRLESMRWVP